MPTAQRTGHESSQVLSTSRLFAFVASAVALTFALVCPAEQRSIRQRVAPVYPEVAKRLRVTGVVRLEVKVDAEGKVKDIKKLSGNHMLSIAAEEAVGKWKFAPASAESTESLDINFELNQQN
jgi:TonB family protein